MGRLLRSPLYIVLFALVLRILLAAVTGSYRFAGLWSLFEMADIGRALATGHGFSAPYGLDTGPSALTAPIYPWIVSLAFRAFGVFSSGAGFAIVVFNSVFSALTCWTIYGIARRVFNDDVAVWSAWAWALLPYAIYYSIGWVWETSLSAFLLSLVFMITLDMDGNARLGRWILYGLVWGLAALINTALLAWLPFSGCWLAYRLQRSGKRFVVPVVISAVVFWMTLTPWLVRNYQVFGHFVFLRDNFGNELRSGNNPEAEGWKVSGYDAFRNPKLEPLTRRIGEPAVSSLQGDEAKAWIAENPGRFLTLCVKRFYYYWAGLPRTWTGVPIPRSKQLKNLFYLGFSLLSFGGLFLVLKKRVHAAFLFVTVLMFYPLTYYITVPETRYRHAIEPVLLMLTVYLVWTFLTRRREETQASAAASGRVATVAKV